MDPRRAARIGIDVGRTTSRHLPASPTGKLIDECAALDANEAFQVMRRREDALRKKLKDKLGVGQHAGNLYVLNISWGTPQQRMDVDAIKANESPTFVERYAVECPTRQMEFVRR